MTPRPTRPLDPDLTEHLDELLAASGRIARRHFYGDLAALAATDKGAVASNGAAAGGNGHRYDPVTEADRAIEELLRAGISSMSPGDRVVGEENGVTGPADAARTWYLDPIDGTKAFLTGMAGWGTLVGVVEGGRAVAGWMDQPVLGETFSAVHGRATVRRRTNGPEAIDLRVSGCTELSEAIMYTTHPSMFGDDGEVRSRYDDLGRRVRLQRFGGDCYAYCMLAAGRVDLVVEADLNSYDIVALIPIIEAAGGVITGPDGRQPLEGGTVVAAATPELAEQAWAVLRP
ncbi:inositol monophosphatase family protein [Dietzia cinnamea]|uniref:Myo-inositol-1(Or 4)-monophosphatase n=1 Tax=Dietzia cinnamea TaxID=321318 RepID=A0A4R3ZXW6_9ACTN|nr:inositol monophosphatase family protein [Dietzia cinnamea]TCW25715.1 myo-inositol-1(or 4)-monophosphatase [Dietzia cinnamea]